MVRIGSLSLLLGGLALASRVAAAPAGQASALDRLSAQTGVRLESYAHLPSQEGADTLRALLDKPLTVDGAVQVAALNNPQFQALLQELDLARAARQQERLLPNPELELAFSSLEGGGRAFEYTLWADLRAVLLYPLHRSLANTQYQQTRMRLADELLEGLTQVKVAYFDLQGLLQAQALLQSNLQLAQASATLAARQQQAGNINALEEAVYQAAFHEAVLEMNRLETEVQTARQTLGQLLGLSDGGWQIAEALPPLPLEALDLPALEQLALTRHPDIRAAQKEVEAARQAHQIARLAFLPSLQVGVNASDEDGHRTTGPALALELPLFDWGQASRAQARAQQAQSHHQWRAREAETRSQVRAAFSRMALADQTTRYYQKTLIPLRQQVVNEAQRHYNYMLLGTYQLLQARQDETAARRQQVVTLTDYWIARAELERATGGSLPLSPRQAPEPAPVQEQSPPPPPPTHLHHR